MVDPPLSGGGCHFMVISVCEELTIKGCVGALGLAAQRRIDSADWPPSPTRFNAETLKRYFSPALRPP